MPRLGETLISLGRQIPDIYRTNRRLGDERLDQQRRMEREDVTWEQQQEEYAKKKALEREAEDAIGRYETGIKAQTPLSEGQEGPVLPERSRFELGMEAGLPRYTEVSPQAKGLFGAISEEEKRVKGTSGGMLSTYYKQKYDDETKAEMFRHPDWSEEQIHSRVLENMKAGNFMVQSDPRNLSRSTKLSEAKALGGVTPTVTAGKAKQSAAISGASTEAREKAVRNIQKQYPMLNKSQRDVLSDSYIGINAVNTLINKIESDDLGFFDINRKTGQFTNPEAEQAAAWLVEIIGRDRSGAAINTDEWKSFRNQTLNPAKLLTEEGKKAALNTLKNKLKTPMYAKGSSVVGNDNWYNDFEGIGKQAQSKAEGANMTEFNSVEEAEAANLPVGTVIYINGRKAVVE